VNHIGKKEDVSAAISELKNKLDAINEEYGPFYRTYN
jgi:hypothetical protein